jgi:hypothetical protein
MPRINSGLLIAVIVLILFFQSSDNRCRLRHRRQRHDVDHHLSGVLLHAQPGLALCCREDH